MACKLVPFYVVFDACFSCNRIVDVISSSLIPSHRDAMKPDCMCACVVDDLPVRRDYLLCGLYTWPCVHEYVHRNSVNRFSSYPDWKVSLRASL